MTLKAALDPEQRNWFGRVREDFPTDSPVFLTFPATYCTVTPLGPTCLSLLSLTAGYSSVSDFQDAAWYRHTNRIDAYIGQQPALTGDLNYKLSAYIRGDSGEFRFTCKSLLTSVGSVMSVSRHVSKTTLPSPQPCLGHVHETLDPSHTSVVIRVNATKTWQKVEGTFTEKNVGTFLIQMAARGWANFAIDNVKIVQV